MNINVVQLFGERKYAEALPLAKQAVELSKKELGKENVGVAAALRNLAYIYIGLDNQEKALNTFDDAYEIFKKNLPLKPELEQIYVETLEFKANHQVSGLKFKDAEEKLKLAIEIRQRINGPESPEISNTYFRLGHVYYLLKDYEKAIPLLRQALDIKLNETGLFGDDILLMTHMASCAISKAGQPRPLYGLWGSFKGKTLKSGDKIIDGGVVNGKAVSLITPIYPAEARAARAEGIVGVDVLIGKTGKVMHACATSGPTELHAVSEDAAFRSKFTPTTVAGTPVIVVGVLNYNFQR